MDAMLYFQQQHAWRLVDRSLLDAALRHHPAAESDGEHDKDRLQSLDTDVTLMQRRLTWLMQAGWDFIETEMGSSEFTSVADTQMLAMLNATTDFLATGWGVPLWTKVHCSTNQRAPNFGNINYNFLAGLADERMAVMPHTVQIFSLTDAAYGTYGNKNFSDMLDFMQDQQQAFPNREIIFYPETAYWVNFDSSQGLFLPIYADRRIRDAEILRNAGIEYSGMNIFQSGFEWSYWLNDVWLMNALVYPTDTLDRPAVGLDNDAVLIPRAVLLLFGPGSASQQHDGSDFLREWICLQRKYLIEQSGMAYLAGDDTWSELGALSGNQDQPSKLTVHQLEAGVDAKSGVNYTRLYEDTVQPLLRSMADDFLGFQQRAFLAPSGLCAAALQGSGIRFVAEMCDGVAITALRAQQVFHVYESYYRQSVQIDALCPLMQDASAVVARRKAAFRTNSTGLPVDTYVGWSAITCPTAYHHRYLWAADQLFFMWRDLRRAYHVVQKDDKRWLSPCMMNFIDPVQIAGVGEDVLDALMHVLVSVLDLFGWLDSIGECLSAPTAEPVVADWSICYQLP